MFGVRTGTLLCCILLAVPLGGCLVENDQVLIDKPAAADRRLAGVWALESDGGAQLLLLSADEKSGEKLAATFVIAPKDEPPVTSRATVTFAEIGSRQYFEVSWRAGEWLPLDPPVRRTFGTYELSGAAGAEILKVCLADAESFSAPLKSGALSGFSGTGSEYERRVVISSSGPALRAYLEKNHFKCSVSSTFRRLAGPPQSR